MRWSKVRKLVEESFAPAVRGRVRVFSTHYACSCGYGSIVADGQEVAQFSTRLHFAEGHTVPDEDRPGWARWMATPISGQERREHPIAVPREFSRFDLNRACWRLIHMNPHVTLNDEDPLVAALAVFNGKVGKGRLSSLPVGEFHPLVRWVIEFRLRAEKDLAAAPATT